MNKQKLPKPNSKELTAILKGTKARAIYAVLYDNKDKPVSMSDIRIILGLAAGEQEHLNRRMRELYGPFNIQRSRNGGNTLYKLLSFSEKPHQATSSIPIRVRAWVLKDQRCVQCGKTPSEDKIKLHVDHIIPQNWGGTDEQENLQALCSDCNEGKKNLYSSFNKYAAKIKEAISYNEPHKRIGELLKAFRGTAVPSELLEMVAKAKQYQDDWQKRMRELRVLGWNYSYEKKKEGTRFKTYFSLKHFEPWPQGNIKTEIRKLELRKKSSS